MGEIFYLVLLTTFVNDSFGETGELYQYVPFTGSVWWL